MCAELVCPCFSSQKQGDEGLYGVCEEKQRGSFSTISETVKKLFLLLFPFLLSLERNNKDEMHVQYRKRTKSIEKNIFSLVEKETEEKRTTQPSLTLTTLQSHHGYITDDQQLEPTTSATHPIEQQALRTTPHISTHEVQEGPPQRWLQRKERRG